ncbi:hypothetical protein SAMN04487944_11468 [Gracilibacillus ureilyticus]|uniref:Lipoprotein n=1 Tax=Gracilibacillus ureilyticus TaxID=531814 RepID=A0A1H9TM09_9BACI|nr:hypothetical protein [Gracilibacillus ureilyticus]SER98162.1 hypothetical protein SAMN04487944_11468 [Gracilibacillus ureilyticus]
MKKTITILLLLFITGCTNADSEDNLTLPEEITGSNEVIANSIKSVPIEEESVRIDTTIDFFVDNKIITIDTEKIPILENFLSTFADREDGISTMALETLHLENLYLLTFNCNIDNCSYMLIDHSATDQSRLLDDFVTLKSFLPSPSGDKLLFIFGKKEADYVTVFNLQEWKREKYEPFSLNNDNIRLSNPLWINESEFSVELSLPESEDTQQILYSKDSEEKYQD